MATPAHIPIMELADVGGIELEVYDHGSGEPLVFIPSTRDEWYAVLAEPALAERYRLVLYHRRGFGNSSPDGQPLSIAEHAADCHGVMTHLGIERAHVAAAAGAGPIALQLTLDFPEAVHSLAVLEPSLPVIIERFNESSSEYADVAATAMPLIEQGRIGDAVDTLFRYLGGPTYRQECDRHLPPGWFDRLLADWDTGLQHHLVAMDSWSFDADDAARITVPVLNLKAENSTNLNHACHDAIKAWIPHAENAVLPDTGAFMPETNPQGTAEALAGFFARHPMSR